MKNSERADGWGQFLTIYEPMIRSWLGRLAAPQAELDDLVQEILMVVLKRIPAFEHNERIGAFRSWLRLITVNCLRDYWKSRSSHPHVVGGSDFREFVTELEDSTSELAQAWDKEHDRFVTAQVLKLIRKDFDEKSWRAFEMVTLEQQSVDDVAATLDMTRNAVYAAKSRIMTRLRKDASGLLDG